MKRRWLMLITMVLLLSASAGPLLAAEAAEPPPQLLPGLSFETIATALTTIIVFVVLVVILGKFAWGPITAGLKAREDKIRKDITDAEQAREKAEATLREYSAQLATAETKVRELLAKATADAEKLAANIKTQAQADAEDAKNRATKDIETAKQAAITELYAQTATLATSIAEKIIKRSLNPDDQRDLVNSGIAQFQKVSKN